jgi:hypothetical protein
MIPMTFNGVRVKSMIIELEDGSLIYKEAPLIHRSPEPIVIETEEPELIEETVEAAIEEPTIEQPNDPPSNKKKGWRKAKTGTYIKIPIGQCEGIASYTTAKGKEMAVAIYKTGTKNGKKWYKLLYVSNCSQFGQHPTGGFFGKADSLSDVTWF